VSSFTPGVTKISTQFALGEELRKIVEARLTQTLRGIEMTLNQILETGEITAKELQENLKSLEESFTFLFQKWNLEILYTLFLKKHLGFGELKKILGVNSRTLSDKLKLLKKHRYVERRVDSGPPLRVKYSLTTKGKNTVLLAMPLLYYSSAEA